jgi:two-component system, NarL family, response regulator
MTQPRARVAVVDDHAVVRAGVASLLGGQHDLDVVASLSCGRETLAVAAEMAPDVVILDVRMPDGDGLEVLPELRSRHPRIRVLMFSGYSGDDVVHRALRLGAVGYLLKTTPADELVAAVRQATTHRWPVSTVLAERLAERAYFDDLSSREVEILRLVARGQSNKEIAGTLSLAEGTVKNHVKSIIEKLRVSGRTEAVTLALRRGILDLDCL